MRNVSKHDLSETSHGLFETHKSYDPRVILFYFVIAALLVLLVSGLAYQQLIRTDTHERREKYQNQRRILYPGPRGDIKDREGRLLVGNRARFAVVLFLDELKRELYREHVRIHENYLKTANDKTEVPSYSQLEQLARVSVAQHYLDEVNKIIGRDSQIDVKALREHFNRRLLLPYTLIDDLAPDEYARLLERLPVRSPVQLYTSSTRYYPYGSAAAHTLGYIGTQDVESDDFGGEDLRTFKMKGTIGREGLEKRFDSQLQGKAGGAIIRVDPTGYKVDSPDLPSQRPEQGKELVTTLDIDLQLAAEEAIGDQIGAAVALDVRTGEVLVLASKPDYNLADLSPRFTQKTSDEIEARKAWSNRAIGSGGIGYPPGSTFKILTSIAGLMSGKIVPDQPIINCDGVTKIGNKLYYCDNGRGHHGDVLLKDAIAHSCDIYYYEAGKLITPDGIADAFRRFHLDERTGIELPGETAGLPVRGEAKPLKIADPAWKDRVRHEKWFPGDTANLAIGQGDTLVTPLDMACFIASVARNELWTKPTLVHRADAPVQHTEPIGLTPTQRTALLDGMEGVILYGTASKIQSIAAYRLPPGLRVAGKTGTAQKDVTLDNKRGRINYAWFICFAPVENPEIAIAVMLEGEELASASESFGGGGHSAPIANIILKKYFEKKNRPAGPGVKAFSNQP